MENGKYQLETGLKALVGLLDEFRKGNIYKRNADRKVLEQHIRELSKRWDRKFPDFPESRFSYTSDIGLLFRGRRDAYLKKIIIRLAEAHEQGHRNRIIVNPACVIGRHTRDLASRLPHFRVIGTDIDPRWNWIYEHISTKRNPDNFEFVKDNIFDPTVHVTPMAVVFFGACGSVSDGAIDYAIESQSPYLIFRTCCHVITGANMKIAHRPRFINLFFRFYLWCMSKKLRKEKYAGFYFSDKYSKEHYPRSETARSVSNSDEFLEVCRNSFDIDFCRTIIDLDRYLLLVEKGYNTWYKEELFVAERTTKVN